MSTLKSCPDCGHKVSPKASSCPRCGRANPGGVSAAYLAVQALVAIGGVMIVFGFIGQALNPPNSLSSQFEDFTQSSQAAKEAFSQ